MNTLNNIEYTESTEWFEMTTYLLFILAKIILDTNINKTTSTF